MRKLIVVGILIVLLFVGTMPATAEQEGGQYQKEITINENSGDTLTDYQVLIELKEGDFPSKAKSDGADIRFTDTQGNELSHWIDEFDSGNKSAKIWVKVPGIPANGEARIMMDYGNSSASSVSDGDATFDFFADFNKCANGDKGVCEGFNPISGTWAVESGKYIGRDGESMLLNPSFYQWTNYTLDVNEKDIKIGAEPWLVGWILFRYTNIDNCYYLLLKTDNYLELTKRVEANQTNIGYIPLDYSAVKTYRIIVNGDNIKVYVNNNLEFDVTDDSLPSGSIAFKPLNAHAGFDDVKVRKFTFPEPTVVAVGPEEIRNKGIPVYFLIGIAILVILLIVGISRKGKGSKSSEPKPLVELLKPELYINITADAGFTVGMWEKLHATIMNVGEGIARNVKLTLSGPIEIGGVKTVPKLECGANKETIIGIKPAEHGNLPLEVSISYMDEIGTPFEINDVAYINVAKEDETVSVYPQSIFNIGSIGEVLGKGATKIGEGALVQRSEIGKGKERDEEISTKCPYCGEALNLPKTPKYCPRCGEQLR